MRLPIAGEGLPFILVPLVLGVAAGVASLVWVAAFFLLLALFTLQFFRDPERRSAAPAGDVLSPADGTILSLETASEGEAPAGLTQKIVIFMNVFNCHVNRAPIAGKISSYAYSPGSKLAAFSPKASAENEQNRIELTDDGGRTVFFKQIAGAIARRIVFRKRIGDTLARGERIGMIRFGSRVDVFLPPAAKIEVVRGARVKAGRTVLASWKSAS